MNKIIINNRMKITKNKIFPILQNFQFCISIRKSSWIAKLIPFHNWKHCCCRERIFLNASTFPGGNEISEINLHFSDSPSFIDSLDSLGSACGTSKWKNRIRLRSCPQRTFTLVYLNVSTWTYSVDQFKKTR